MFCCSFRVFTKLSRRVLYVLSNTSLRWHISLLSHHRLSLFFIRHYDLYIPKRDLRKIDGEYPLQSLRNPSWLVHHLVYSKNKANGVHVLTFCTQDHIHLLFFPKSKRWVYHVPRGDLVRLMMPWDVSTFSSPSDWFKHHVFCSKTLD
jgi:hypothetical protein